MVSPEQATLDCQSTCMVLDLCNMGMMVMNKSTLSISKRRNDPNSGFHVKNSNDFIDGLGAWKWSTDQTLLECVGNLREKMV